MTWRPWRDDSRYKLTAYIGLGLFILVLLVDLVFNYIPQAKTISQYITARALHSWRFLLIVLGILVFLIFHFLYRPIREWIRRWFGR